MLREDRQQNPMKCSVKTRESLKKEKKKKRVRKSAVNKKNDDKHGRF